MNYPVQSQNDICIHIWEDPEVIGSVKISYLEIQVNKGIKYYVINRAVSI